MQGNKKVKLKDNALSVTFHSVICARIRLALTFDHFIGD